MISLVILEDKLLNKRNNQILELEGAFELNWENLFIPQRRKPRLKKETLTHILTMSYLATLLIRLRLKQRMFRLRAMSHAFSWLFQTATHLSGILTSLLEMGGKKQHGFHLGRRHLVNVKIFQFHSC